MLGFKKQVSILLQFIIRGFCGALFLSIVNTAFASTIVGINALSLFTVGLFGVPGVVLLYATKLVL